MDNKKPTQRICCVGRTARRWRAANSILTPHAGHTRPTHVRPDGRDKSHPGDVATDTVRSHCCSSPRDRSRLSAEMFPYHMRPPVNLSTAAFGAPAVKLTRRSSMVAVLPQRSPKHPHQRRRDGRDGRRRQQHEDEAAEQRRFDAAHERVAEQASHCDRRQRCRPERQRLA